MSDQKSTPAALPPLPDSHALNAAPDGIFSDGVPPAEREAYALHAEGVRASLAPADYLQQRLTDRAALALWRLEQVARWEAAELERAAAQPAPPPIDLRLFGYPLEATPARAATIPDPQLLERAAEHHTRWERILFGALRELRALQSTDQGGGGA